MSLLDNIHNYYETLVIESLAKQVKGLDLEQDALIDVICVALNQLTPRYIRYEVDMVYFTTTGEMQELRDKADKAVSSALKSVKSGKR